METKLVQLRDMGFHDEKKNAEILKGLGGNLERTIESLVRLGEGSAPISRSRTPNPPRNITVSQPLPPLPKSQSTGAVNGISFATNGSLSQNSKGNPISTGFGSIDAPIAQPTRNFTSPNPFQIQSQSVNPFDTSSQQPASASLETSFQNMQLSQQPLFPNATGGYPSQPHPQELRFQTMTPPVPQMPQQYMQSNPITQPSPVTNGNYNPFYQNATPSNFSPSNPFASNGQAQSNIISQNPYQSTIAANPPSANGYSIASTQPYAPQTTQDPSQQQLFPQQPSQQIQPPQAQAFSNISTPSQLHTNPAQATVYSQTQQPPYYNQPQTHTNAMFQQYQSPPLQPQQTGRIDKTSILNLYNYPQLAPQSMPSGSESSAFAEAPKSNAAPPPQRSVTMPLQMSSGNRNPFQTSTPTSSAPNGNPPGPFRHTSQESVDIGGYQTGRHSPDAFASLSASFVR